MTNPVNAALNLARANELRDKNVMLLHDLQGRLGVAPAPGEIPTAFLNFCKAKGVLALPAQGATVAAFILASVDLGLDTLVGIAAGITRAHSRYADPCSSWYARRAFQVIGWDVQPPRSWTPALQGMFGEMPWPIQRNVAEHERRREAVMRNSQNDAAEAKRQLKQRNEKKNVQQDKT
jgi:hypothetical protein